MVFFNEKLCYIEKTDYFCMLNMRKILYILIFLLTLSFVMSCGRGVDKRLVLADTLMWTNPDSSLAILEKIDSKSLTEKENQAYYALLLTQAQFRCNGNCTTDTLINSALEYYSDNHNREHYTRSLLYKGAYYEFNTNQPVEAIKWYKQAEDNADTTDYRNLAQINFRMGRLYYTNYAGNNLDLEKFKKALNYSEKLCDNRMKMLSFMNVADIYRLNNHNDAINYYNSANRIAHELNDTTSIYTITTSKALLYLIDSLYYECKNCIFEAFKLKWENRSNNDFYILSQAYANLNMIDSAEYFLNNVENTTDDSYERLQRYRSFFAINKAKKNFGEVEKFNSLCRKLSDSLEYNNVKYDINSFEISYDDKRLYTKKNSLSSQANIIACLITAILFIVLLFCIFYFIRRKNQEKLINKIENESFLKYQGLLNEITKFDKEYSKIIKSQLASLESIMSCAYEPNTIYSDAGIKHKVLPIADSNIEFWNGLISFLNHKYDGIIDNISKEYPKLTNSDINFIALMCCGFSDAAIAVCRKYRNTAVVRSRRNAIKKKMNIDEYLEKFLNRLMEK